MKILSKSTGALVTSYADHTIVGASKMTAVCDSLVADGHTNLDAYKVKTCGEDRRLIDDLLFYIAKSFATEDKAILAMDTKSLSKDQKDRKSALTRTKGRIMGDIRRGIKSRIAEDGRKGKARSFEEVRVAELTEMIEKVRNDRHPAYDPVKVLKNLKEVVKSFAPKETK